MRVDELVVAQCRNGPCQTGPEIAVARDCRHGFGERRGIAGRNVDAVDAVTHQFGHPADPRTEDRAARRARLVDHEGGVFHQIEGTTIQSARRISPIASCGA